MGGGFDLAMRALGQEVGDAEVRDGVGNRRRGGREIASLPLWYRRRPPAACLGPGNPFPRPDMTQGLAFGLQRGNAVILLLTLDAKEASSSITVIN